MTRSIRATGFLADLLDAGHFLPIGVEGCYGTSATFESIVEAFERLVDRTADAGGDGARDGVRFPPVLGTDQLVRAGFVETMPQLVGVVHGFDGDERDHRAFLARFHADGEEGVDEWIGSLQATDLSLTPTGCYPLYGTCRGRLDEGGRTFDLGPARVFRREPSLDPARLQSFRMREIVRIAEPDVVRAWRADWIGRGASLLESLGLEVERSAASDPFFGRGGRVMADAQLEQELKVELVVPVGDDPAGRAVASFTYHQDHFGAAFAIEATDGSAAHSSCLGFGLERVALALFWKHGLEPREWPTQVRTALWP